MTDRIAHLWQSLSGRLMHLPKDFRTCLQTVLVLACMWLTFRSPLDYLVPALSAVCVAAGIGPLSAATALSAANAAQSAWFQIFLLRPLLPDWWFEAWMFRPTVLWFGYSMVLGIASGYALLALKSLIFAILHRKRPSLFAWRDAAAAMMGAAVVVTMAYALTHGPNSARLSREYRRMRSLDIASLANIAEDETLPD